MKTVVAVCTYNALESCADLFVKQLDSLRNQSLKADIVLIQDDCSSDRTVDFIYDYIGRHDLNSWLVMVNQRNVGFACNFHSAAMRASTLGDIVFFCDQDDEWDIRKIEIMLPVFEDSSYIDLLCHEYIPKDTNGIELERWGTSTLLRTGSGQIEKVVPHAGGAYIWLGWTMAVRSSFLSIADAYWFDGWAHDEWVWKCSQAISSCYVLHRVLGVHYVHGSNATGHKIRSLSMRVLETEAKWRGDQAALKISSDFNGSNRAIEWFERSSRCEQLRLELLRDRKLINAVFLLLYLPYYQAKRSWLVELAMGLRGI